MALDAIIAERRLALRAIIGFQLLDICRGRAEDVAGCWEHGRAVLDDLFVTQRMLERFRRPTELTRSTPCHYEPTGRRGAPPEDRLRDAISRR
jgi:hypothetical protein